MKYNPIDIKCPNCRGLAKFEEPFEFLTKNDKRPEDGRPMHQWGGWTVLERFPSQVSWHPPSTSQQYLRTGVDNIQGGYPVLTNGLVQCPHCHSNTKHNLDWPMDSYWQWEIRGELLWAWDKNHAEKILKFIKATIRPSRRTPNLKYIPSHFLSSNVRDLVVKKMELSINA